MMDSLPDDVITHILSFLPTKESASTSILSKRWRNLFTFSPNLELDYYNGRQSFVDFTDRLLSVSEHSPLKNIILRFPMGLDQAHINCWTHDALNRGVLEFELVTTMENSISFEVFTCKTLVKLNLTRVSVNKLPENAFLPALKTLVLSSVLFRGFQYCAFDKLLSACPVLEDLNIRNLEWEERKWPRVLSSPSLLRLTIGYRGLLCFDGSYFEAIVFDTPNVTYLNYSGCAPASYRVVCLDSLVKANLAVFARSNMNHDWTVAGEYDSSIDNPTNLIKGLKNVKIIDLSSRDSLEMFYFFREAIPVFNNLFHLSITSLYGYSWRGLPYLLNNSPNLHTLIFKVPLDSEYGSSDYSCLLSCPVKVLKITKYSGTAKDMRSLTHFLGTLSCLELLEVNVMGKSEDMKLKVKTDLLMLPRASSKCKINIK